MPDFTGKKGLQTPSNPLYVFFVIHNIKAYRTHFQRGFKGEIYG